MNQHAITTVDISGREMQHDIPAGTTFQIGNVGSDYTTCYGLPITQIWNSEYEILDVGQGTPWGTRHED